MLLYNRAGCNYSGVSGSSEDQLRWDRLGYSHLAKLAAEKGDEAYVVRTPSIEFWDEGIPGNKLDEIRDYLEDVSDHVNKFQEETWH